MDIGEAMYRDFMHMVHGMYGDRKVNYRCDFSCLGDSELHDLCKGKCPYNLRKFLKTYKGSVDIVDPESGVTPLLTACQFGNLNSVRLLVKYGANINHRCSGLTVHSLVYADVTPIYVAAQEGHESIVEYLGNQGADVNVQMSPMGFTPLHQAVFQKHEQVVRVLVTKFKAKVSIPCNERPGAFPIFNAVLLREPEILDGLLMAEDLDVNVADPTENVTALHVAAYEGHAMSVDLLILIGADVNVQLKSGHSPLDLAIQERNKHIVDCLKKHGAQRKVLDKPWHPFITCVQNGLTSLKAAINWGADINSPLHKGLTALQYCVLKRRMDACKFLLRKGADLEIKDIHGRTALHFAAQLGLNLFIDFLLEKGANIHALTALNFTPLHLAAIDGHATTCKLLLSKGANIEAMASEIGTPLMAAIASAHITTVKVLLRSGANPNARNPEGSIDRLTTLFVALQFASHKPEILKALVEAGVDVRDHLTVPQGTVSPLHILPHVCTNVETMRIMIEAGAYVDAQAVFNNRSTKLCLRIGCSQRKHCKPMNYSGTPLQASKDGDPNLVQLLENTLELFKAVRKNDLDLAEKHFALGGLVNCCSVRYDTPIIYASWKGYADMVKFLLGNGAKIDMPNVKNSSPLHYAAKFNQKDVAIQLLKAGAPIGLVRCNKTPLELAKDNNHDDLAALFEFVRNYLNESPGKIVPFPCWKNDPKISRLISESGGKIQENDLEALFSI